MSMLSSILRNPFTNLLTGGASGTIADTFSQTVGRLTGGPAAQAPGITIGVGGSMGGPLGIGVGGSISFPFGGGGSKSGPAAPSGGTCPRGYHLNKHALAASKRHGALPARSTCVRNRSMNPMNPRAITRSLRRIKRATKVVRRLHAFAPVRHRAAPPRRK
jgi:hypothetical protein